MTTLRKFVLGGTLAVAALASAVPAQADHGYGRRGDTTGAAVAGGIVGLALGAAIASSARHDRYYDGPRYPRYRTYFIYRGGPGYYRGGWPSSWERRRWERRRWEREQWERERWAQRRWRGRHWDRPYGW